MKQLRRSMLFVPANHPGMMFQAPVFKPDCIIFDLEDAIPLREKDSARDLLVEAIRTIDFGNCEIFARINPLYTPSGEADVRYLAAAGLKNFRLPMTESPKDIQELDELLTELEKAHRFESGSLKILGAIETAKGVLNAPSIAVASGRLVGISFGAEDFTRSMTTERSKSGEELFWARSHIVIAAMAAGIDAIDTVFADLDDEDAFIREVKMAKQLGFSGKSLIHPRQIQTVHTLFSPGVEEIRQAARIIAAMEDAEERGAGVIVVDGKMVDEPVLVRARRIMDLAKGSGLVKGGEKDA
jgi:citrate lyase subunit beta/citryl-CoA lyase